MNFKTISLERRGPDQVRLVLRETVSSLNVQEGAAIGGHGHQHVGTGKTQGRVNREIMVPGVSLGQGSHAWAWPHKERHRCWTSECDNGKIVTGVSRAMFSGFLPRAQR